MYTHTYVYRYSVYIHFILCISIIKLCVHTQLIYYLINSANNLSKFPTNFFS